MKTPAPPTPPTTSENIRASIDRAIAHLTAMRELIARHASVFDASPGCNEGVLESLPALYLHHLHGEPAKALARALGGSWKRTPSSTGRNFDYEGKVTLARTFFSSPVTDGSYATFTIHVFNAEPGPDDTVDLGLST